jgi:ribonuclease P protein component
MAGFSFPKKLRLLKPSDFAFVFQRPIRISSSKITIFSRLNVLDHPRIGMAIAKKHVKTSPERNRIKRLVRESFRLHQHKLLSMDYVILVKKGVININNESLSEVLERLRYKYYH